MDNFVLAIEQKISLLEKQIDNYPKDEQIQNDICALSARLNSCANKIQNAPSLRKVSTKFLYEELKKREGVKAIEIAPYEEYSVISKEYRQNETGPAGILVVID